jgi:hypothetical protein
MILNLRENLVAWQDFSNALEAIKTARITVDLTSELKIKLTK